MLYSKRCFMHWYLAEGMEESEFKEATENVAALVQDYNEIEDDTKLSGDSASEDEYWRKSKEKMSQ